MMSLKYDDYRFYWAVVIEKYCLCKGIISFRWISKR